MLQHQKPQAEQLADTMERSYKQLQQGIMSSEGAEALVKTMAEKATPAERDEAAGIFAQRMHEQGRA